MQEVVEGRDKLGRKRSSNSKLAEVLVLYLEQRFQVKDCTGDLKSRLQRCREAAALTAKGTKSRLERWLKNYRAISNARFDEADEHVYTKLFLCAAKLPRSYWRELRSRLKISRAKR